jgi:HD-like signal output (HDOD) protein
MQNLERFWDASSRLANVSGWLAWRLKNRVRLGSEDAYTFGLFRDCGMALLIMHVPEYRQIVAQAEQERELAFTAGEDERLSINHAIIGAELAEDWMLPADFCEGIRHHHAASAIVGDIAASIPENASRFIALTMLAQHLIQRYTDLFPDQEWEKLGENSLNLLQLTPEEITELAAEAEDVVKRTL